tara:strand:- start:2588 stop:3628 length:1041 start_codon:yes stop_codon:yes gene_type:complete
MNKEVSIVIQTAVRDNLNILEWIVYHFLIGIDKIIIYDDCSKKPIDEKITTLPEKYKNNVIIHRIDSDIFLDFDSFKKEIIYDEFKYYELGYKPDSKMSYFQSHFIKKYNNKYDYCFMMDVDEYICLKSDLVLHEYIINTIQDFDAIYFPWLMYGNSGLINFPDNYLVIDRLRIHDCRYHSYGKSLIKMKSHEYSYNPHIIDNEKNIKYLGKLVNSLEVNYSSNLDLDLYINHYFSISALDTLLKFLPLRPDGGSYSAKEIYNRIHLCNFYSNIGCETKMNKFIKPLAKILNKDLYDKFSTKDIVENGFYWFTDHEETIDETNINRRNIEKMVGGDIKVVMKFEED